MHKIQRNHSTGIKMSKINVFLNQACRVAYVFIFVAILHKSNRWQPMIISFLQARNLKNIVNQINIRFVFVCALPSIGYGIFIWHIKKYWYHKNYCSVPKHCCLKPQLASATPYYRQTRMKIGLYSFKYVIGLRHQLKTTQSNVSFWHCFKHCQKIQVLSMRDINRMEYSLLSKESLIQLNI